MKKIGLLILTLYTHHYCTAQNASASSSQPVKLELARVVSTGFNTPGSGGGGTPQVNMPLNGTSAMAEGIESAAIEVTMQSNANYDVNVSASSNTFTYTGTSTFTPSMQVKDVLSFMIVNNNTGGTTSSNFSQYQPINGTTSKLAIGSGHAGVSTFSFKYKAQPGFNYPAGTYTADIVFTVVEK